MQKSTVATGKAAEDMACDYLSQQGLTLLSRNYHCPRGELDLVMQEADTIVFVEVRYRKHTQFGSGAETVTRAKQSRLITTALHYLQTHPKYNNRPSRFDVISICPQAQASAIDWIKDAFQS